MSRAAATILALILLLTAAIPVAANDPGAAKGASRTVAADGEPPLRQVSGAGEIIPGQVIVKWRDAERGPDIARARGLSVVAELGVPGRGLPTVLSTQGRSVDAVIGELSADPAVEYAEPDYVVTTATEGTAASVAVNDPLATPDRQYSLDQMRVRDAWTQTTGGSNVIAVLDTGVQANHPDLVGRVLPGYNFVSTNTNAADDNGHGTWVAGIIAANTNNGRGIAGISWSDKILPVKIMNSNGTGSTSNLTSGILWAANNGATIINMSVGGFPYSKAVEDAVNYAWSQGAVLVGAAGNNNRREDFYPASYANVISVSATQREDEFSWWSSYGPRVEVSAPGSSILTTNCTVSPCVYATQGETISISGTSFATPNVAGVVALIKARYPNFTPSQIVDRLYGTVDDLGYPGRDEKYGRGRVNAFRAVGGSPAQVRHNSGDAFEGNNTLGSAKLIPLGTTVWPTIYPAGDVDWFAVDLPRHGRLDVRVTGVVDDRPYPWNRSSLPIDPIVELWTTSGHLLKVVDNEWESGTELAQHTVTGPARILVRVTNFYANGNPTAYSVTPTFVDEVPPRILSLRPAPGSVDVSPSTDVTFSFSERVWGVDNTTVSLRTSTGVLLPAAVSYNASTGFVRVTPSQPLPAGSTIRLVFSPTIKDEAGLSLTTLAYSFSTSAAAPSGSTVSGTQVAFRSGTHVGHKIGSAGDVTGLKPGTLSRDSGASSAQRAKQPNLPGAWLLIENGMWAGYWVRESPQAFRRGTAEVRALPTTTRLTFDAGTHVGRQFDAVGNVIASRTYTLDRASGANVDAIAVINGARHYRVINGIWAGYWIAESPAANRAGIVERFNFSPARRIQIPAGTHTGLALDASGNPTGSKSYRLERASGAPTTAWAVVNGRAYVLVSSGVWAGYWLPETSVLAWER